MLKDPREAATIAITCFQSTGSWGLDPSMARGNTHFIMALVANASYQILAWSYSFQILYEVSHRNQAERETLKSALPKQSLHL
jgi:hypothetical protein